MIVLSVLDRLLNPRQVDREQGQPVPGTGRRERHPAVSTREFETYRDAVKRDLEWLLNTRKIVDPLPEGLKEVEKSVYCYGLPDFSRFNLYTGDNQQDRERLAAMIARTIELFEPRILDLRVTASGRPSSGQALHFRVDGRLKLKPRPQPVCYDTMLDVTRGEYDVEVLGEGRA
jgi:type VI secretion system protein ImpF